MAAAPLSLELTKGEAVTFTGTHQVSASDPTVVDITAWTITVTVHNSDGTTLFTKTGTVTNGPKGQYSWSTVHADTMLDGNGKNVPVGVRDLDIWRTDAGAERELGIGKILLLSSVLYGS